MRNRRKRLNRLERQVDDIIKVWVNWDEHPEPAERGVKVIGWPDEDTNKTAEEDRRKEETRGV